MSLFFDAEVAKRGGINPFLLYQHLQFSHAVNVCILNSCQHELCICISLDMTRASTFIAFDMQLCKVMIL